MKNGWSVLKEGGFGSIEKIVTGQPTNRPEYSRKRAE
jgi:hypothetical protein